jgi:hypothetical protein
MLKPLSTLIAAALLLGVPTMPADAAAKEKPAPAAVKKKAAPAKAKAKAAPVKKSAEVRAAAQRTSAAAGMKVPMVMAASVRASGRSGAPVADAVVYTDRHGDITGVTIKTAGLPDPERLDGRASRYVVWLVGRDGERVRKLGELESHNGARAVFGFTADAPLKGFERLMITTEAMAHARPQGAARMSADIAKVPVAR